jgi:hypothetical protein
MHVTPEGTFRLPLPPKASRSFKMGTQKHFTGCLVFGEDEGQAMEVESHTEMLTALVMLARRDLVGLENQVPFRWTDLGGDQRTHFFDFRVSLRDGSRVALIVKHSKKAEDAEFQMQMRCLARQVPADFANRVSLITEKHLDPTEVFNAELIHSVRQPDPETDAVVERVVAALQAAAKISDIVAAAGCGGNGFRAVVRLIRNRKLDLVAHERIGPGTLVRRRDT